MELPLRRFAHDDGDRPVRAADDAEAEGVLRLGRKGSGLTSDLTRAVTFDAVLDEDRVFRRLGRERKADGCEMRRIVEPRVEIHPLARQFLRLDLLYGERILCAAVGEGKRIARPVRAEARPGDAHLVRHHRDGERLELRRALRDERECRAVDAPAIRAVEAVVRHGCLRVGAEAGLLRQENDAAAVARAELRTVQGEAGGKTEAERVLALHLFAFVAREIDGLVAFGIDPPLFHKAAQRGSLRAHTKINDNAL